MDRLLVLGNISALDISFLLKNLSSPKKNSYCSVYTIIEYKICIRNDYFLCKYFFHKYVYI